MKRERNAKQAFIEGTIRVVARDGLDKTTTKAIATEAGLSEAYIYRCFESKEALLCAAFHMEDVAFAYFLKQNLVGMHIQNAQQRIRQLMDERGWTIYRLAQESKLSQTTISNIFKRNN